MTDVLALQQALSESQAAMADVMIALAGGDRIEVSAQLDRLDDAHDRVVGALRSLQSDLDAYADTVEFLEALRR